MRYWSSVWCGCWINCPNRNRAIAKHPAIPRVLVSEHLHGRSSTLRNLIAETMQTYEQKIADLLANAKQQGLARPALDQHAAATLYIGMIQGLGFFVGKFAATLWGPVFPKYVLLETGDALRAFVLTLVICLLASVLAIRTALKIDPAEAIGG